MLPNHEGYRTGYDKFLKDRKNGVKTPFQKAIEKLYPNRDLNQDGLTFTEIARVQDYLQAEKEKSRND